MTTGLLPAAIAHGVGGRADLPVSTWMFAYSAGFALVISFVLLGMSWPRPRLARMAVGRVIGAPAGVVRVVVASARVVVAIVCTLSVVGLVLGPDDPSRNLAPVAVYVGFWVGVPLLSAVVGDVWRVAGPPALVGLLAGRSRGDADDRVDRDDRRHLDGPAGSSAWLPATTVGVFCWVELAYHAPAARSTLAALVLGLTVVMSAPVVRRGRRCLEEVDGFGQLFRMVAAMAPFARRDGSVRTRVPGSGLATLEVMPGGAAVLLVVLGATTFDGVTRTRWWGDLLADRNGWPATLVATVGLVVTLAVVAGAFRLAVVGIDRVAVASGRPAGGVGPWVPSLVPIVVGYTVAHYFSLAVFEGQRMLALLSDPADLGWNLFGTADRSIDYLAVSPNQIAWVQVAAIVIGHVMAVVVAHDRAVERLPPRSASRSQRPLLAVMISYTVSGLLLLLNA